MKSSLLIILLISLVPGIALAQSSAAETQPDAGGPFSVQAGLGFTADPEAFLLNFEGDYHFTIVSPAAYVRYSFDLSEMNTGLRDLTPFVQGGLGFTYIDIDLPPGIDDDDIGFMFNFGFGAEYAFTDHISVSSKMLFNILPVEVFNNNFYYSWEVAAFRYRF
jgi:opacity protein-like surface antigen